MNNAKFNYEKKINKRNLNIKKMRLNFETYFELILMAIQYYNILGEFSYINTTLLLLTLISHSMFLFLPSSTYSTYVLEGEIMLLI